MLRLIEEACTKLNFEELSAMTQRSKDETDLKAMKAVQEEKSLSDSTLTHLRSQVVEKEKEISEVRKANKKLEKRNKNLKDSIEKLIEEKRQIEELSKIIEDQNVKIEEYEKEIDEIKSLQKAAEEKQTAENRSISSQASKSKGADLQLLQKQIELLSGKNLELKAELDRRTRLSDQMKREHEVALKDRNELLSEVKTLKLQVEDMRHRLDRSLALLVKKRKGGKDDEEPPISSPNSAASGSVITSKGTQTQRDKSPSKIPVTNQYRKAGGGGGGRLILNSVGKGIQKDSNKKTIQKDSSRRARTSVQHKLDEDSSVAPSTISEKSRQTDSSHITVSESIQQVKGKGVVSDIRNKLEKWKIDTDYVLNLNNNPTPKGSVRSGEDSQPKTEDVLDLFEVLDDDDSCPRKV